MEDERLSQMETKIDKLSEPVVAMAWMEKRKTTHKKSALQPVGKTLATAPVANGKMKFSESQDKQMTDEEFDKYQEAISEAMRNGNFNQDITGAAR